MKDVGYPQENTNGKKVFRDTSVKSDLNSNHETRGTFKYLNISFRISNCEGLINVFSEQ